MKSAVSGPQSKNIIVVAGIFVLLLGLLFVFSLVEPVPAWVALYQIMGIVLVSACVMCFIYLSFRAYEVWWEVLGCFFLVVHLTLSVALAYGLTVMTIMFVTDPSKAVCTERLVQKVEFPDYHKTLYFFSYKCVPDGMSLVKVQPGSWPILETVGMIPDPMDLKMPNLIQKNDTVFIEFNGQKASYNLRTGDWSVSWSDWQYPPAGQ